MEAGRMSGFNSLIDGMVNGLGMWIIMTVLGILSFFALKKQFTKWFAKIWSDIKKEVIELDGATVDVKIKAKKSEKKQK